MVQTLLVLLLFLGASLYDDRLDQLAGRGSIQENAAVKASSEIAINAPPERVWSLLTDVRNWPAWQKDITKTEISGAIEPGTESTWTSGTAIHSRIALVQPFQELVWTGTAYKANAIHVWKLERLPGNHTLLKTSESMDGFLLTLFFSSKKLEESHRHWLTSLKIAAEQSIEEH